MTSLGTLTLVKSSPAKDNPGLVHSSGPLFMALPCHAVKFFFPLELLEVYMQKILLYSLEKQGGK